MTSSLWAYLANIYRQHLEFSYLQQCLLLHVCESRQLAVSSAVLWWMVPLGVLSLTAISREAGSVCVAENSQLIHGKGMVTDTADIKNHLIPSLLSFL